MTIREAGPRDYPMTLSLAGPGGSGKTMTALMLATAFANGGKVGFVDTEDGRGERYYKHFNYLYLQLDPPFSPERYIEAMDEMRKAGVASIVVDSASLEWAGAGGCLEIHAKETGGNSNLSMIGWSRVKPRHRNFIEFAKRTGIHTIMCFRAVEKSKPNPNKNAPRDEKIINLGYQPVTNEDASFEFALTGMFKPGGEGTLDERPEMIKSFIDFRHVWKPGIKVTPKVCQDLVEAHRRSCVAEAEYKKNGPRTQIQKPCAQTSPDDVVDLETIAKIDAAARWQGAGDGSVVVWLSDELQEGAADPREAAAVLANELKREDTTAERAQLLLDKNDHWVNGLPAQWRKKLTDLALAAAMSANAFA